MENNTEKKPQAPWWVYVIVIVAANLGKQQLMPEDASFALTAGTTVATIAVAYALVSVGYKLLTDGDRDRT